MGAFGSLCAAEGDGITSGDAILIGCCCCCCVICVMIGWEMGDAIVTLIGVAGESIDAPLVTDAIAGDMGASAGLAAGAVGGMSYFWIWKCFEFVLLLLQHCCFYLNWFKTVQLCIFCVKKYILKLYIFQRLYHRYLNCKIINTY